MTDAVETQFREDEHWVAVAIDAARKAVDIGESPFGAVIVASGEIIAIARNQTSSTSDPTRHAEMVAIDAAIRERGAAILKSATLYSSCAPCMMCLGTAYYSGIRRLVYSLRISDVVARGSGDPSVEPDEFIESCGLGIETRRDIRRLEALRLLDEAFQSKGAI